MVGLQLSALQSLVSAVSSGLDASYFCRDLVHTVLPKFGVKSAAIFQVTKLATFEVVGAYGVSRDFYHGELGSVFQKSPIACAIRNLEPVTCRTLGAIFPGSAGALGVSDEDGAIALPLFTGKIVSGALMLTFENPLEANPFSTELMESLQVAAANFIASSRMTAPPFVPSSQPKDARYVAELTDRQRAILAMLAEPLTYSQMGRQLHASESLVKQESGRIFRYLGVNSRRDAVRVAQDRNLLELS